MEMLVRPEKHRTLLSSAGRFCGQMHFSALDVISNKATESLQGSEVELE
jgi:hypothetical protein